MNNFKIILGILLTLILNFQVFGQAFKIEELEKFNKLDMSSFKNEIKSLNYSYYDKIESSDYTLFEYDSPDYEYKIAKFEFTADKTSDRIEFQFKDKKEYDQYLKVMSDLGYKKTESGKIPGGETYVDYFKNKSQIRMVSPQAGQSNEPYTILVFK